MRRRDFMAIMGGAVASVPLAARAQQERMRRIAILMGQADDDPEGKSFLAAFLQELHQVGWTDGRNARIDIRWGAGNSGDIQKYATDIVATAPDVILAGGGATLPSLEQATRSVPIVFTQTPDPVGAGFVDSLARPGGNATGFMALEYGAGVKWLEMLKEIVPGVKRVAIIRDAALSAGLGFFGAIQAVAPSFGVELTPVNMRDGEEIVRSVTAFARSANGGLIVTGSALARLHRDLIVGLAAKHRLPAIYFASAFVHSGGLISYGADFIDQYRRAAGYVDRILKGENPADLPVQAPTKFELAVNLKTAKTLGLTMPPSLLLRADEVIE